jgi:cysteine desulfurase family protein (TIGR01976 family)
MSSGLDIEKIRAQFPALSREVAGRPAVFLDGPAGSQVPQRVADAVGRYLLRLNANCGGVFATSEESDALLSEAHRAVADLLGSRDPDLVAFGPNMTTLTLGLARALARTWKAGDEVVVTRLEHDANFTPWVQAATDAGATVREVGIREADCTLDMDDLESKLSERTRLVAVGAASNAVGTINPVREIVRRAHAVGALVFVDAVHYAPHAAIDVEEWGCDFLACSAYKFFGPHVGILWGRRALMAELPVYKLRPASNALPERWMTGTQSHEGIAGTLEAVEYLADLGRSVDPQSADRRSALLAAYRAIVEYERGLTRELISAVSSLPGVRVWGIRDPGRFADRVPTLAITHETHRTEAIARHLASRGVFVWHGNYYALPLTEALGLEPEGMVRIGTLHYNTSAEIGRLLEALSELTGAGS